MNQAITWQKHNHLVMTEDSQYWSSSCPTGRLEFTALSRGKAISKTALLFEECCIQKMFDNHLPWAASVSTYSGPQGGRGGCAVCMPCACTQRRGVWGVTGGGDWGLGSAVWARRPTQGAGPPSQGPDLAPPRGAAAGVCGVGPCRRAARWRRREQSGPPGESGDEGAWGGPRWSAATGVWVGKCNGVSRCVTVFSSPAFFGAFHSPRPKVWTRPIIPQCSLTVCSAEQHRTTRTRAPSAHPTGSPGGFCGTPCLRPVWEPRGCRSTPSTWLCTLQPRRGQPRSLAALSRSSSP